MGLVLLATAPGLGHGVAPPGRCPWPRAWGRGVAPLPAAPGLRLKGVGYLLPAAAPDLGHGVTPLVAAPDLRRGVTPLSRPPPDLGRGVAPLGRESAALNMPANLEKSAVATGLEKVSFHSNPKER